MKKNCFRRPKRFDSQKTRNCENQLKKVYWAQCGASGSGRDPCRGGMSPGWDHRGRDLNHGNGHSDIKQDWTGMFEVVARNPSTLVYCGRGHHTKVLEAKIVTLRSS